MRPNFLFNFKRQFADSVAAGTKRQTIRGLRKDGRRPVPGDRAALYCGLRTRDTRLLGTREVVACRAVRFDFEGAGELFIDGEPLRAEQRSTFARADGFADWPSMLAWFRDQYGALGGCWDGFLVEWA